MSSNDVKKAVRLRMAQTGEKYTTALRALENDPEELERLRDVLLRERLAKREQKA
jgi:hypothetical protein